MSDKEPVRPSWQRLSGIGIEFAGAVGGFALLGYWIDGRWNTRPWALLICVGLGLMGGTYNLVREALAASRPRDRSEKKSTGKT